MDRRAGELARVRAELDEVEKASGEERLRVLEALHARLEAELDVDEAAPPRR